MSAPRFTRQTACAMAEDILLENAVDASIVAFWRKDDNQRCHARPAGERTSSSPESSPPSRVAEGSREYWKMHLQLRSLDDVPSGPLHRQR
jgi:hypothetical protein